MYNKVRNCSNYHVSGKRDTNKGDIKGINIGQKWGWEMSFVNKLNNMVDQADNLLNYTKGVYEDTKKDYQVWKRVAVIGTLILAALCIGVMYIRFRVFGG